MLTLTLRAPLTLPLELDGVRPDHLARLSADDVLRQLVLSGNRREELGHFFAATGDAADGRVRLEGDLRRAAGVGRAMASGELTVAGPVGNHAGAGMTGGTLFAESAGDWLGAEMRGGSIVVSGDAGDHAAGVYPGSRLGVRGGQLHVGGSVGAEAAALMRRGLLMVGGDAGAFFGAGMIAGTAVVAGAVGPHVGAGMKRGTLLLREPPELPAGFVFACRYRPAFAGWFWRQTGAGDWSGDVLCFRGDALSGGRGEVLVRADRNA